MRTSWQIIVVILAISVVVPVYAEPDQTRVAKVTVNQKRTAGRDQIRPGTQLEERRKRSTFKKGAEEKKKSLANVQVQ